MEVLQFFQDTQIARKYNRLWRNFYCLPQTNYCYAPKMPMRMNNSVLFCFILFTSVFCGLPLTEKQEFKYQGLDQARVHLKSNRLLPEISGLPITFWCCDPVTCDGTFAIKFTLSYISSCWNKIWNDFLWVLWVLILLFKSLEWWYL